MAQDKILTEEKLTKLWEDKEIETLSTKEKKYTTSLRQTHVFTNYQLTKANKS